MDKRKRSLAIVMIAVVFATFLTVPGILNIDASALNVYEVDGKIRVAVGSTSGFNIMETWQYRSHVKSVLNEFAEDQPTSINKALITFDDFLTPEDVQTYLGSDVVITTAYIWMPNKTGRAMITVHENDLEGSIQDSFMSLNISSEPESEYKSDMLQLQENYGIFAVEIESQNSMIQAVTSQDHVEHVELLYNEYAENLALESGKPISYVCVPEKPDGTL